MKTIEIIAGILAGAAAFAFILYLAVRILKSGREAADENTRIYEERYRSPKP